MSGPFLGAEDTIVNKINQKPCLKGSYILEDSGETKYINNLMYYEGSKGKKEVLGGHAILNKVVSGSITERMTFEQ